MESLIPRLGNYLFVIMPGSIKIFVGLRLTRTTSNWLEQLAGLKKVEPLYVACMMKLVIVL